MSKHTPGPWVAREINGAGWPGQRGFAIDYNADQEQVVDFVYEEADARLIAAAPDLLSALELTFKLSGDRLSVFEEIQIRDIIIKAKGNQP